MSIRDRLGSIFAFTTAPTTALLVLVYAVIFTAVLTADNLPSVPKNTRGLDLDRAWWDLHQVSARPHTFNSHANDLVRDFILERLRNITAQEPHVTIDYDVVSNASWATALFSTKPRAVYQEGNNILVKIQGTEPSFRDSGGYLLSAHYDSVSTAPGTTDDSMGVVTVLQMVDYFAKHRPKRTVVFNINNNEESGLNGAHTFLEHPWAGVSDVFLNLEGAAAGGRPVMFRATSIAPLYSWTQVPHPHANVIAADAFARGVVRSGTDYSVYEKAGLDGLDFAFYKGRSRYHTRDDSISGMAGGKKALWAMMEATHGASLALANHDTVHPKQIYRQEKPVYFELFGSALVILSLDALFITNVILLSTGPILILLLTYSKQIIWLSRRIQSRYAANPNENGIEEDLAYGERALEVLKKVGCEFWSSTKLWVALAISIGLQAALVAGYVRLNPFILHSHPFLVFTSAFLLAYLSIVPIVSFPCNIHGMALAPEKQKLSILLQLYGFTWVLLVFSTAALRSAGIGGTYLITAWNVCALLGCLLALIEAMANMDGIEAEATVESERHTCVEDAQYQAINTEEDVDEHQSTSRVEEDPEPTETTPLVPREQVSAATAPSQGQSITGWWIIQLLLVVPLPVILMFHIVPLVLGANSQTLTDGNSPAFTYGLFFILALLLVVPMSPFSIHAHRWLTLLVLAIFILSTAYAWVAFPFSHQAPLKVYFAQTVDLTASGRGVERATTLLMGPKEYLTSHIIPELPSAVGKAVECNDEPLKRGLRTCTWEVGAGMAPSPGGTSTSPDGTETPWISYRLNRTGSHSAQITVQGLNTRYCNIAFTNRHISGFSVAGDGDKGLQEGYAAPAQGLSEIQLWSRDFGKRFEVTVEWKDEGATTADAGDRLKGRVSCGWDEYESATIGGGRSGGKIPSLEEVMQFLPEWAVVSKSSYALFSAGRAFEV